MLLPNQRSSTEVIIQRKPNLVSSSSSSDKEMIDKQTKIDHSDSDSRSNSSLSSHSDSAEKVENGKVSKPNIKAKQYSDTSSSASLEEEEYYASYEPRLDFLFSSETKGLSNDESVIREIQAVISSGSDKNVDQLNIQNVTDETKLSAIDEISDFLQERVDVKEQSSSESSDESDNEERKVRSQKVNATFLQPNSGKYQEPKLTETANNENKAEIKTSLASKRNDLPKKFSSSFSGEEGHDEAKTEPKVNIFDGRKRRSLSSESSNESSDEEHRLVLKNLVENVVTEALPKIVFDHSRSSSESSSDSETRRHQNVTDALQKVGKNRELLLSQSSFDENEGELLVMDEVSANVVRKIVQQKREDRRSLSSKSSEDERIQTEERSYDVEKKSDLSPKFDIHSSKSSSDSSDEVDSDNSNCGKKDCNKKSVMDFLTKKTAICSESSSESTDNELKPVKFNKPDIETETKVNETKLFPGTRKKSLRGSSDEDVVGEYAGESVAGNQLQKKVAHQESSSSESNDEDEKNIFPNLLHNVSFREKIAYNERHSSSDSSAEESTLNLISNIPPIKSEQYHRRLSSDPSDEEPSVGLFGVLGKKTKDDSRRSSSSSGDENLTITSAIKKVRTFAKGQHKSSDSSDEQTETAAPASTVPDLIKAKVGRRVSSDSSDDEKREAPDVRPIVTSFPKIAGHHEKFSSKSSDEESSLIEAFVAPDISKKKNSIEREKLLSGSNNEKSKVSIEEKILPRETRAFSESSDENLKVNAVTNAIADFITQKIKRRGSSSSQSTDDQPKETHPEIPTITPQTAKSDKSLSSDEQSFNIPAPSFLDPLQKHTDDKSRRSSSESRSENSESVSAGLKTTLLTKKQLIERKCSSSSDEESDTIDPTTKVLELIQKTVNRSVTSSDSSSDDDKQEVFEKPIIESLPQKKHHEETSSALSDEESSFIPAFDSPALIEGKKLTGREKHSSESSIENAEDMRPNANIKVSISPQPQDDRSRSSSESSGKNLKEHIAETTIAGFLPQKVDRRGSSSSESSGDESWKKTSLKMPLTQSQPVKFDESSSSESSDEASLGISVTSFLDTVREETKTKPRRSSSESSCDKSDSASVGIKTDYLAKKAEHEDSSSSHEQAAIIDFPMQGTVHIEKVADIGETLSDSSRDVDKLGFFERRVVESFPKNIKHLEITSSESSDDSSPNPAFDAPNVLDIKNLIKHEISSSESSEAKSKDKKPNATNEASILPLHQEYRPKLITKSSDKNLKEMVATKEISDFIPQKVKGRGSSSSESSDNHSNETMREIPTIASLTAKSNESSSSESSGEKSSNIPATVFLDKFEKNMSDESRRSSTESSTENSKNTLIGIKTDFLAKKQSIESVSSSSSDEESDTIHPRAKVLDLIQKPMDKKTTFSDSSSDDSKQGICETPIIESFPRKEHHEETSSESSDEESSFIPAFDVPAIIADKKLMGRKKHSSESSIENEKDMKPTATIETSILPQLQDNRSRALSESRDKIFKEKNAAKEIFDCIPQKVERPGSSSSESTDDHSNETMREKPIFTFHTAKSDESSSNESSNEESLDIPTTGFLDSFQKSTKNQGRSLSSEFSTENLGIFSAGIKANNVAKKVFVDRESSSSSNEESDTCNYRTKVSQLIQKTVHRGATLSDSSSDDDKQEIFETPIKSPPQKEHHKGTSSESSDEKLSFIPAIDAPVIVADKKLMVREKHSAESSTKNAEGVKPNATIKMNILPHPQDDCSRSSNESSAENLNEHLAKTTAFEFLPQKVERGSSSSSESSSEEKSSDEQSNTFDSRTKVSELIQKKLNRSSTSSDSSSNDEKQGIFETTIITSFPRKEHHEGTSSESSAEESFSTPAFDALALIDNKKLMDFERHHSESSVGDSRNQKPIATIEANVSFQREEYRSRSFSESSDEPLKTASGNIQQLSDFIAKKATHRNSSSSSSSSTIRSSDPAALETPLNEFHVLKPLERSSSESGDEYSIGQISPKSETKILLPVDSQKFIQRSSSEFSSDHEMTISATKAEDNLFGRKIDDHLNLDNEASTKRLSDDQNLPFGSIEAVVSLNTTDIRERFSSKSTKEHTKGNYSENLSKEITQQKMSDHEGSSSESSVEDSEQTVAKQRRALKLTSQDKKIDTGSSSDSDNDMLRTAKATISSFLKKKMKLERKRTSSLSSDDEQAQNARPEIIATATLSNKLKDRKRSSCESSDDQPTNAPIVVSTTKKVKEIKEHEQSFSESTDEDHSVGKVIANVTQTSVEMRERSLSESTTTSTKEVFADSLIEFPPATSKDRNESSSSSSNEETEAVNDTKNPFKKTSSESSNSSDESLNDKDIVQHDFENVRKLIQKAKENREKSFSDSTDKLLQEVALVKPEIEFNQQLKVVCEKSSSELSSEQSEEALECIISATSAMESALTHKSIPGKSCIASSDEQSSKKSPSDLSDVDSLEDEKTKPEGSLKTPKYRTKRSSISESSNESQTIQFFTNNSLLEHSKESSEQSSRELIEFLKVSEHQTNLPIKTIAKQSSNSLHVDASIDEKKAKRQDSSSRSEDPSEDKSKKTLNAADLLTETKSGILMKSSDSSKRSLSLSSTEENNNRSQTKSPRTSASVAKIAEFFQSRINSTEAPDRDSGEQKRNTIKKEATVMGKLIASFQKQGKTHDTSSSSSESSNDEGSDRELKVASKDDLLENMLPGSTKNEIREHLLQSTVSNNESGAGIQLNIEENSKKLLRGPFDFFHKTVDDRDSSSSDSNEDENKDAQQELITNFDLPFDSVSDKLSTIYKASDTNTISNDSVSMVAVTPGFTEETKSDSGKSLPSYSDQENEQKICQPLETKKNYNPDEDVASARKSFQKLQTSLKDSLSRISNLSKSIVLPKSPGEQHSSSSSSSSDESDHESKGEIKQLENTDKHEKNIHKLPNKQLENAGLSPEADFYASDLAGQAAYRLSKDTETALDTEEKNSSSSDSESTSSEKENVTATNTVFEIVPTLKLPKKVSGLLDDEHLVSREISIREIQEMVKDELAEESKSDKAKSSSSSSSSESDREKILTKINLDETIKITKMDNDSFEILHVEGGIALPQEQDNDATVTNIKANEKDAKHDEKSSSSSSDDEEKSKFILQQLTKNDLDDFDVIDDVYEKNQRETTVPSYDSVMQEVQEAMAVEEEQRIHHPIDPALATIEESTDEPSESPREKEDSQTKSSRSSESSGSSSEESSEEDYL